MPNNKICIFTFSYSANRQSMLNYLEKIMPENSEIFLFTTKEHKTSYHGKRIKIVNSKSSKFLSMFELRKFCIKNNIKNIISLGLIYEAIPMLYSSLFSKTNYIIYQLGNPIEGITANKGLTKIRSFFELLSYILFIPLSKRTLFCSKEITNWFKKYFSPFKNRIFYLPTTVPTEIFKPMDKQEIRKKLGFSSDDKILIFVGRIGYLKGLDFFINAVNNNPDKKFILVGNLVDNSANKTYKNKHPTNLLFVSPKSQYELAEYYNAADLCFFPSRLEGVALVPRESMSSGTPAMILDIFSSLAIEYTIKLPLNNRKINQNICNFFNLPEIEKEKLSKKSREYIVREYDDQVWKSLYIDLFLN